MFFTQEDYIKIQQWLVKNSVKDTEFNEANIPFNGEETITIVQGNQNKKVFLKDLIAQVFNLGISDFVNITDKYDTPNISLEEAIRLIPSRARKEGQVITFLDRENHWHIYQFKGVLNQWNVLDTWEDLFDWENLIIDSILPDEEDLTKSPADTNGNSYLSLKDREYNPEDFSGLGRVIIRKNIVELEDPIYGKVKKNVLTKDMINKSNTIYEIRYDFDLNGKEIIIPEGCVLEFSGGSFNNGIVIGNNTVIRAGLVKIFDLNINLSGSWSVTEVYPEWFGAKGDGIVDDTTVVQRTIDFATKISKLVYFSKTYYITNTINVTTNSHFSENAGIKSNSEGVLFHIKANWTKHYNIHIYRDKYEFNNKECAIFIDAYNVTLYSPSVFRSNCGIAFNQFHTDIISPRIYDCNYGIIASAKGDNAQINLCRVFGGVLSSIKEYAIYLGGYEQKLNFLPINVSKNVIHGSSISFFGTQIMGTAFVSNIGNVNFIGNEFEEANFGKGTGLEIGTRVHGLHLENAYFNGYNYSVKYNDVTKETNNISIKNIVADNVKYCVIYCYIAGGFDVYLNNIKSLNNKPELHLGTAFNTTGGYYFYNTDELTKGNLKNEIIEIKDWIYPNHKYMLDGETVISSHNEYILRKEEKNDIYPVSINTYNIVVPKENIYDFIPHQRIQIYYANTYRDLFIHKIDYTNNIITVNINIAQYGVDLTRPIKCPKANFVLETTAKSYSSDNRPINIKNGDNIFDTTLNKPVWWTGSKWVDATGADV